jgi:hypothetical protein
MISVECKQMGFTHKCPSSTGVMAIKSLLNEYPLVIEIAAIDDAAIQPFHFICQSNRVVFDFRPIWS